jgi:hypothetical protein
MPYVDKIIDFINDSLQANTLTAKGFQRGKFYGLAKQIWGGNEGEKMQPVIYSIEGNEISPAIDSKESFQVYHRVTDIKYDYSSVQTGDGTEHFDVTYQCKAVVYADKSFVKMTDYDLSFLLITGLSMNVSKTDLGTLPVDSVITFPVSSDMDQKRVFENEYGSGFVFNAEIHDSFFSVNYNIVVSVNKNCLSCSDC